MRTSFEMQTYYRQLQALVPLDLTKRQKLVEKEIQAARSTSMLLSDLVGIFG